MKGFWHFESGVGELLLLHRLWSLREALGTRLSSLFEMLWSLHGQSVFDPRSETFCEHTVSKLDRVTLIKA